MPVYNLTPKIVRGLAAYMCQKHGAQIVDKGSAVEMKLIAQALDQMGIQKHDQFLASYATTIGQRIYLPFDLGDTTGGLFPLWQQVATVVHECQHVRQYKRNPTKFVWLYLTSDAKRAQAEAEAYHASLEMRWFLRGTIGNVFDVARKLLNYGCEIDDVMVVSKHLKIAAHAVKRGKLYHQVSKDAVRWLKNQARLKSRSRR